MFLLSLLLSLLLSAFATADPPESPTVRVGMPLTLTDIYIPGGEARPKPRPNRESPLVIRLLEVKPAQDGKRYDLEVYGLETGHYDLATFLEAVDPATLVSARALFGRERSTPELTLFVAGDMHEHLGQLIAYARTNQIVPPWSR